MKNAEKVAELLMSEECTAAQVARVVGCSLPTAYNHIDALRRRGLVRARRQRVEERGPLSSVYSVRPSVLP